MKSRRSASAVMSTLTLGLATLALANTANALEPVSGQFLAAKACPALQSVKKRSNPGNIELVPGTAYKALGLNKAGGDKIQIVVPGAPKSSQRWVQLSCGDLVSSSTTQKTTDKAKPKKQNTASKSKASKNNLLALNWQPSFCEHLSRTTECKQLNAGRMKRASRELTLHGLWPQPRSKEYCGVSASVKRIDTPRTWHKLPEPKVDRQTRKALDQGMPGAISHLDRHEWVKHGTCYGANGGADEYYDDSLYLLEEINASAVGRFFSENVGRKVSARDIRQAFDEAFGTGAGERVRIRCERDGRRQLISEIWISLYGDISPDTPISDLILAARPTRQDCASGILDRAGLQ